MDPVSDLFALATLALLLTFLIAKLVSFAMIDTHTHSHTRTTTKRRVRKEPVRRPVHGAERLTVQTAQSKSKVQFISPVQVAATYVETQRTIEEATTVKPDSNVVVVESPVKSDSDITVKEEIAESVEGAVNFDDSAEQRNTGSVEEIRSVEPSTEIRSVEPSTEIAESVEGRVNFDESTEQRNTESVEEIRSVEPSTQIEVSAVGSGVKENDDDDYDDDDWEGIERSELEKEFMAATEFVGCEENGLGSVLGNNEQMELYGLHKVATEGPCRDPQPMPLKLSARAKWNAWQKLENMSPEVAMEQYISLLSDKVPGWMKDTSAGMSEHEPTKSEVSESATPDLSTSLSRQQMTITEREIKQESGSQDHSQPAGSD